MKELILFYCCILLTSCNKKEETIFPTQSRLTESVYSSAIIQPDSLNHAFAAVNGRTDRIIRMEDGQVI